MTQSVLPRLEGRPTHPYIGVAATMIGAPIIGAVILGGFVLLAAEELRALTVTDITGPVQRELRHPHLPRIHLPHRQAA